MTEVKINIEDLRQHLRAAEARQRALVEESRTIEADTREAAKTAARERAQAARNGESVAHIAADLDIEHLRSRRDELPWELWSARITTAQLARDLHQAELEEAEAESRQASIEFEGAQRGLALAEKRHANAYAASSTAGARVNRLRGQLREDARTLQSLEEAPPRV